MGSTLRRATAAVLTALLAVFALTACSGNTSEPVPSTSPVPTAAATPQITKGPPATYEPDGKPLVLIERTPNLPGFIQDGDEWWCGDDGVENEVGNVELTKFGNPIGVSTSDTVVESTQTKSGLEIKITPTNPYCGGIVTHGDEDGTQVPFVLPLIKGGEDGYAPYFSLPTKSFGTAQSVTLCPRPR